MIEQDQSFMRQLGIANPAKFKYEVTILGVGSVGSAAAIACGKMGVKGLTLIDFDIFEIHNVSNQLCLEQEHVGKEKVFAIKDLVIKMSPPGLKVTGVDLRLLGKTLVHPTEEGRNCPAKPLMKGVLINCPDDMIARKDAWNLAKFNPLIPYVIDVRMAAQMLKIYIANTMNMASIQRYEATLHSNEEASEAPCGERSIIYTSLVAGAMVSKFVKNIQLGDAIPDEWDMDLHNGTVEQSINGKSVASREEHALAFLS
jgi:hypothetical protein